MLECGVRFLLYVGIKLRKFFIIFMYFMYLYIISYILKLLLNDVVYLVIEVF